MCGVYYLAEKSKCMVSFDCVLICGTYLTLALMLGRPTIGGNESG